jgi:hypothetical protein
MQVRGKRVYLKAIYCKTGGKLQARYIKVAHPECPTHFSYWTQICWFSYFIFTRQWTYLSQFYKATPSVHLYEICADYTFKTASNTYIFSQDFTLFQEKISHTLCVNSHKNLLQNNNLLKYVGRSSRTGNFNFTCIKRDASVAVLTASVGYWSELLPTGTEDAAWLPGATRFSE